MSIEIPDWAVEAAAKAFFEDQCPSDHWVAPMDEDEREAWRDGARKILRAALEGWLEGVAWGVRYEWEGIGKSEIRDLRFDKDSAEGAAFARQSGIPPGFPIKVTAQPLYTLRKDKTP